MAKNRACATDLDAHLMEMPSDETKTVYFP